MPIACFYLIGIINGLDIDDENKSNGVCWMLAMYAIFSIPLLSLNWKIRLDTIRSDLENRSERVGGSADQTDSTVLCLTATYTDA